jgi:hypothetical protein
MRVRTCLKCKKYCPIHSSNPENLKKTKLFEKMHSGHTIVTLEYSELTENYKIEK